MSNISEEARQTVRLALQLTRSQLGGAVRALRVLRVLVGG